MASVAGVSLTYSSVVAAPVHEVFDWHERPGAISRLAPPWQPLRVAREARSLRDGRAVLKLPFGLTWVAQHQGCEPPHRFVDELDSPPLRWVLRWRHTHEFEADGPRRTRVTDHVDTQVPGAFLRAMFTYRHRQLADDLAANARTRALDGRPLTVAVTGGSGLVGSALVPLLTTAGHTVVRLVRHPTRDPAERPWRPDNPDPDLLAGVDAVVHLAGAGIAGRFTSSHRHAIRDSRIPPTRALAALAARTPNGPRVLVCASAIGYYGPDRGDETLTEHSDRGTGFLADVVADWEQATEPARDQGIRVVNVRTGIVQSPRGGTLRLFHPLFLTGLGGRLGDGHQWQSWVGIDDLADIYHRALVDEDLAGPVNAVAPHPVRNADYARVLGHVLHRPARVPVPSFAPRLLIGAEGNRELAAANQRVLPARLTEVGHTFRHPQLEMALRHVLGREVPQQDAMPAAGATR